MHGHALCLREILAGVFAAVIAAALLVPSVGGHGHGRLGACAGNLRQLYQLGAVYAATHRGEWPRATGSELWISFTHSTPPLIDPDSLEVLLCPVKDQSGIGACDYLGPRKPVSELKSDEALAADKPGNHGTGRGGNVLLKDGSVLEFDAAHPVWATLSE